MISLGISPLILFLERSILLIRPRVLFNLDSMPFHITDSSSLLKKEILRVYMIADLLET
jgi:hypothetical protein